MKRILSVFLCIALLCGGIAVYAAAEEQTVEERVAEMLQKDRVPGKILVRPADGATREQVEALFASLGVEADADALSQHFDGNSSFIPARVSEERIFDVLVALLQNGLIDGACPDYVSPPIEAWQIGDVDTDGDVDANDYLLLKRAVIGTYKLTEAGALRADANGNGRIDSFDYLLVKRHVLGTFKLGIEWSV